MSLDKVKSLLKVKNKIEFHQDIFQLSLGNLETHSKIDKANTNR